LKAEGKQVNDMLRIRTKSSRKRLRVDAPGKSHQFEHRGIGITRALHGQARDKLGLGFMNKGEVELKNIQRRCRFV